MWIITFILFWKHAVSMENETFQQVIKLGAVTNGDQRQEDTNETFSLDRYSIIVQWCHIDTNENGMVSCRRTRDKVGDCNCHNNMTSMIPVDPSCLIDLNVSSTFSSSSITNVYSVYAPSIMTSLIDTLGWRNVIVIYENFTAKDTDRLIDLLSDNGVLVIMYNIDTVDLNERLMQAYKLSLTTGESLRFAVLCRFICVRNVLRKVNNTRTVEYMVFKEASCWLMAVYGDSVDVTRGLKGCADDLHNVAVFSVPQLQGGNDQDLRKAIVQVLHDLKKPNVTHNNTDLKSQAVDNLKAISEAGSHPVSYTSFTIETLEWIQPRGRDFSPVGHINFAGNVTIYSNIFPNTKYKFNKRKMIVSTLEHSPFVIKTTDPNGTVRYGGMCIDLLEQLSNTLNFTYELIEPSDGVFGSRSPDGRWNGLVGQLERQEVDMVVATLTVQPERRGVIDFTYPFYYDYTTVLLKKQDPDKNKWKTLIEPLQWQVLVSICVSVPVMSFLVFVMERYNPYYNHPERHEAREVNGGLHSFAAALWYMYGTLLCQGGDHLPDSLTGRTMVSCWGLFSIVVVGTYCGNLIAFLTVPIDKPPFNTLKELIELKGEWKWGTQGGTYYEFYFQESKMKEYSDIGKGIIDFNKSDTSVLSTSIDVHVDKVRAGGYAFIVDKTFTEIIVEKECSLMKMKEEFLPLKYAIGLPKNSPYAKIMSDEILSLHESGLLQIWKQRWWPKSGMCSEDLSTVARPIRAVDVQSAFYLAVIGIVLSTFVLLVELCINFFKKRKEKNMSNVDSDVILR
ncbi:hypothetical protein ACJMK2_007110 [Sinanodonta woodiana]|uniref:Uncharacterized protein n=1 Tax=Sinanodonta woodiana TaxID=1069815 RepID=A0ABD3VHF4_SINWO